jgi:hypothetical protein
VSRVNHLEISRIIPVFPNASYLNRRPRPHPAPPSQRSTQTHSHTCQQMSNLNFAKSLALVSNESNVNPIWSRASGERTARSMGLSYVVLTRPRLQRVAPRDPHP